MSYLRVLVCTLKKNGFTIFEVFLLRLSTKAREINVFTILNLMVFSKKYPCFSALALRIIYLLVALSLIYTPNYNSIPGSLRCLNTDSKGAKQAGSSLNTINPVVGYRRTSRGHAAQTNDRPSITHD